MNETHLNGESKDIVAENIQQLKQLFPEVFAEDSIDFDKLKAVLGETGTLRPCPEESKDWSTTKNLYIEGDNLEVLKLLQKTYHNKVKMIYIDPPYNTGNDFVYPDDYKDNLKNYKEITGQVDSGGKNISTNSESSGRYHTNWLNMMYPRLRLARNLLHDDGVIFISIDDHEVDNLKKMCNEVFGEENFIAQIIVQVNKGGRDYLPIAKTHEYLLCYVKSQNAEINLVPKTDMSSFKFSDSSGKYELRELRNRNPKFNKNNRPNLYYPIYANPKISDQHGYSPVSLTKSDEFSIEVFPLNSEGQSSCWRWGKPRVNENIVSNDPRASNVVSKQKRDGGWNIYEKNRKTDTKAKALWDEKNVRTERGTIVFRELFGKSYFDHPKPIELVQKALMLGSNSNSLILDYFSGSSTTAHAVLNLNTLDGGSRKFIMVQLPETVEQKSEASNAGYENICEIGRERIRLAGDKIKAELTKKYQNQIQQPTLIEGERVIAPDDLDIGFKVFKLDSSNLRKWQPDADNLNASLEGRSELDVVYEIMLKYGIDLTLPIEEYKAGEKTIYSVGLGALMICLDTEITTKVAQEIVRLKNELKPEVMRVVFRDTGFKDAKTNTKEILRTNGVDEIVSI